jgi:hypothetical protein
MAKICHAHCPDEGGGILAAVVVVVLAAIISAAAVIIEDVLAAVLVTAAVLVVAIAAVLVHVLRRDGLGVLVQGSPERQALPAAARTATVTAIWPPQRAAIEAPAQHPGLGQLAQVETEVRRTPAPQR